LYAIISRTIVQRSKMACEFKFGDIVWYFRLFIVIIAEKFIVFEM